MQRDGSTAHRPEPLRPTGIPACRTRCIIREPCSSAGGAGDTERDIDMAFASLVDMRADALVVAPDALFASHVHQLVAVAARHSIPTLYWRREFAEADAAVWRGYLRSVKVAARCCCSRPASRPRRSQFYRTVTTNHRLGSAQLTERGNWFARTLLCQGTTANSESVCFGSCSTAPTK